MAVPAVTTGSAPERAGGIVWGSLYDAIRAREYSVEEFAALLGKKERTVYAYLRGEVAPPVAVVAQMSRLLKCNETDLRQDAPKIPPVFLLDATV